MPARISNKNKNKTRTGKGNKKSRKFQKGGSQTTTRPRMPSMRAPTASRLPNKNITAQTNSGSARRPPPNTPAPPPRPQNLYSNEQIGAIQTAQEVAKEGNYNLALILLKKNGIFDNNDKIKFYYANGMELLYNAIMGSIDINARVNKESRQDPTYLNPENLKQRRSTGGLSIISEESSSGVSSNRNSPAPVNTNTESEPHYMYANAASQQRKMPATQQSNNEDENENPMGISSV